MRWPAVLGQKPAASIVCVRDRERDAEDAHLEHVAGFRAVDVDRAGEDVSTGTLVGHLRRDVAQRLLYFVRRKARPLQTLWRVRDQRFHFHGVAGRDAEHRFRRGAVIAPGDGGRRRCQMVKVRPGLRGCGRRRKNTAGQSPTRTDRAVETRMWTRGWENREEV